MEDDALRIAMATRSALERAIAEQQNAIRDANSRLLSLQKEVADVDAFIAMWHRLTGTPFTPTAAERSEIGLPVVKRKRPKNPDRELVVEKVLEIIREHGEPVTRKDLFAALKDRGIEIHGKDAEMVLSTMLWRSQDRIERLAPFGYWPTGVEYPPATELKRQIEVAAASLAPVPR